MACTEPIRDPAQVQAFLDYYRKLGQHRNHVLVTIGVYTALRISDILRLRCQDVYDIKNRRVREIITVVEKKTGKRKTIALHKDVIAALRLYLSEVHLGAAPLILNQFTNTAISRVHAYRLIDDAAKAVGIPFKVSCHSLRKTFGYHAWQGGTSPVILMEIYNHDSYAVTKRYLGVNQDDQNTVYRGIEF